MTKRTVIKVDQTTFNHIQGFLGGLGGHPVHVHDMEEVRAKWAQEAKERDERKKQNDNRKERHRNRLPWALRKK